jgi:hypothetical protein
MKPPRKYLAPERYDETAAYYESVAAEWRLSRASDGPSRAERFGRIARAERLRACLARAERGNRAIGDLQVCAAERELEKLGGDE